MVTIMPFGLMYHCASTALRWILIYNDFTNPKALSLFVPEHVVLLLLLLISSDCEIHLGTNSIVIVDNTGLGLVWSLVWLNSH
jgi:hypothetical protein